MKLRQKLAVVALKTSDCVGSNSKEIEQRICIFLAQHNLSLSLADSLVPLLRKLFPKDQALAGVTLGKQKAAKFCDEIFFGTTPSVNSVP